jgi:hypothetical protein
MILWAVRWLIAGPGEEVLIGDIGADGHRHVVAGAGVAGADCTSQSR